MAIREIALFQALKVPLARDGVPVAERPVPVLVSRGGVMRVYVDVADGWSPKDLTAELVLEKPGGDPTILTDSRTIARSSDDSDPGSVFAFHLEDSHVVGDTSYQVRIVALDADRVPEGEDHPARYPRSGGGAGFAPLYDDAGGLELVLVPVRYDTDGSGRLPDTGFEQLARYDAILRTMMPFVTVNLTLHDPIPHAYPPGPYGFDFDSLNYDLMELRDAEEAPENVYYFGLVMPADTFDAYCGRECVLGQSFLVQRVSDSELRVGAGIGFPGDESAITLAHELGHMHGREHAPCNVPDPDPDYPYDGGQIGILGYDRTTDLFKDPVMVKDYMGYCPKVWTSDYTFLGVLERAVAVNTFYGYGTRSAVTGTRSRLPVLACSVSPDGSVTPKRRISLRRLPGGEPREARFFADDGKPLRVARASLVRHGHGGGSLFVEAPPLEAASVEVPTWAGMGRVSARLR